MSNFSVSIICPTLNNANNIHRFLKSIRSQSYLEEKIEIVISDGGSVDNTLAIARKYNCKIVRNPYVLADPGVNVGIKNASGDILIILAVDNILRDKFALEKYLKIFENKNIIAVFPEHVSSNQDSIYTKYINLFTDPFSHFVYGYAANARTFNRIYKIIESNELYDLYDFSSNKNVPLIAFAQGFAVRKGFRRNKKNSYDDVSPVIELINAGNNIAFAHSIKLYHHTVRDIRHFANKQVWATINALQKKNYGISHRVSYLSESQSNRIKFWPVYSLTLIPPFIYALYYLFKDRERMWIFHPFLCIISGYSSVYGTIKFLKNKNAKYKRK